MLQSLPTSLLVSAGAFLLFAILSIVQSLRGQKRSGCLSTILMTITLFAFLIFTIRASTGGDELATTTRSVALALIGAAIFVGIVLTLLDRRGEDETNSLYSRGILSIGTGILLLAGFYFVPQIPNTIIQVPSPTPISQAVGSTDDDTTAESEGNIVPTSVAANATATPMDTPVPTITRTPLPEPSPTRTRRAYVPPTPTATPESVQVEDLCGAVVLTNLNVRAEDTVDAEIVAIIPEQTRVALSARNEEGTWWVTEFEGETGWVAAEFLQLDPVCGIDDE